MDIKVKVRYGESDPDPVESTLRGVSRICPVWMPDEEVYREGFDEVDPNQSYIEVYYEDGSVGTFRASFTEFESV